MYYLQQPLICYFHGVQGYFVPLTKGRYGGDKPLTTTQLAQNIGMPYTSLSCNSSDSGKYTDKTFESSQITATEPPQIEKTPPAMQEIIPIPIKRTKQTRMPKSTVQETKFAEPNTIAKQAGWLEIALLPAYHLFRWKTHILK